MIRSLRRVHRGLFVLLPPLVVTGFVLALAERDQAAKRYEAALGAPPMVAEAMTAEDGLGPGSLPRITRVDGGWVVRVPRDWSDADVLVYATAQPSPIASGAPGAPVASDAGAGPIDAALPSDARLLGALPSAAGREHTVRFEDVDEGLAVLYGLAHDELLFWGAVEDAS